MKLTAAKVRSLKNPGRYGDGGTLFLVVAPGGSKSWVQRLTVGGVRRDIGLGGYPLVTLAEARGQAFENRRLARSGGDPLAEKRKAKMPVFATAAERTLEAHRGRWRSAKVAKNWQQRCRKYVLPAIGTMRVDSIGREDVLRILTPIWTSKPETARKVREIIRSTLSWCEAHGFVQVNVAGSAIDGALPSMPAVRAHFRALPYADVVEALAIVSKSRASVAVKLAFRFVVLTACRSGEVRNAMWSEVDTERRLWIVPASRMKANVEHRVPLSDPAMAVLEQARMLDDGSGLIFPSPARPRRPMSDMTLAKLLRDNGLADRTTIHGLRSTFRDWCAETSKPREIAEAALAHAVAGVEGAYFRSDLFERRRHLMDAWAQYITGESAKVVKLHG